MGRARAHGRATRLLCRGVALALSAALLVTASAFAAVSLKSGAIYTGKSPSCSEGAIAGTTCVFKFRASGNGRSLQFIGKPVVDGWGCGAGGGEALLGGKLKSSTPTPIPLAKIHANGSLSGSVSYVMRPTAGPVSHYKSSVTGHLSNGGKAVVITFRNTLTSGHTSQPCATQPVTLSAH